MEHSKALLLIAVFNRTYQNPPLSTSTLDCITAKRPHPCSLCAKRAKIKLTFPTPPLPRGIREVVQATQHTNRALSTAEQKLQLKKKERDVASAALVDFGNKVRLAEQRRSANQHRPKSSYFPASVSTLILDNLLSIASLQALSDLVKLWTFATTHTLALYDVVLELQSTVHAEQRKNQPRKLRARRKAKKVVDSSESEAVEEEEEVEGEEEEVEPDAASDDENVTPQHSSPNRPPAKRARRSTVLEEVTNQGGASRSRAVKEKIQPKAAAVAADYRPPYRTTLTATSRRSRRG
ncbi:hypothetical protein R3P38DRAFT_2815016 [Favolaschia claudopus]|uniref:Uncharacterized protein n=1 Tax=Favolaschia claudopus TaxID=2862362 RepID=A0AAV9Z2A2_9AGAR